MSRSLRLWIGLVVVSMLAASIPAVALGAPPSNDAFSAATTIGSLPYTTEPALSEATVEPGEPGSCEAPPTASVWYSYRAGSSGLVRVALQGENAWLIRIAVFRVDGPGIAGLTEVYCSPTDVTDILFDSTSGSTYAIQLATTNPEFAAARLDVSRPAPPSNDAFGAALSIPSLPYTSDLIDLTAASLEADEPADCHVGERTVWFDYLARADASLTGTYQASSNAQLAVFTGGSLTGLSLVDCFEPTGESRFAVSVRRGETYHFRMSVAEGNFFGFGVRFELRESPAPEIDFRWIPGDPVAGEDVQFVDRSLDPAGFGIDGWQWRFDDGTTAEGEVVVHRYAKNGSYPVTLTIHTPDGREASLTKTVQVQSHDIGVARLKVPKVGVVGRKVRVEVDVASRFGPETVDVVVYRSSPNGDVLLLNTTIQVPRGGHGRHATVVLTDKITAADATVGTVTYRVVLFYANGYTDLDYSDNQATSPPVRVKR